MMIVNMRMAMMMRMMRMMRMMMMMMMMMVDILRFLVSTIDLVLRNLFVTSTIVTMAIIGQYQNYHEYTVSALHILTINIIIIGIAVVLGVVSRL